VGEPTLFELISFTVIDLGMEGASHLFARTGLHSSDILQMANLEEFHLHLSFFLPFCPPEHGGRVILPVRTCIGRHCSAFAFVAMAFDAANAV